MRDSSKCGCSLGSLGLLPEDILEDTNCNRVMVVLFRLNSFKHLSVLHINSQSGNHRLCRMSPTESCHIENGYFSGAHEFRVIW